MPQVGCNRTNPHLVVPHLIVRTPLPTGTAPATMDHIDTLNSLIAAWASRIGSLEVWREDTVDPALASLEERMTDVEVGITPVGAIMMWPTATPPARWLLCDGTEYDAADYPELAALIGTGGLTFTVPDFRDRFPRAATAPGDVLGAFAASTAAPVSTTAIPTTGGSTSHSHTFTTGAAGAHTPSVTVATATVQHDHGAATGYAGDHTHIMDDVPNHQHDLGSSGTPITAFTTASLQAALSPLPYAGNESIYQNLDVQGGLYTFVATYNPQAYGYGYWSSLWKSSAGGSHTPTVKMGYNKDHAHTINPTIGAHTHTASASPVADHTHAGTTANGSVSHQHSVDKTTGWDAETRPKGFLINFIIRY